MGAVEDEDGVVVIDHTSSVEAAREGPALFRERGGTLPAQPEEPAAAVSTSRRHSGRVHRAATGCRSATRK
jgi:hypothetical protein